MRSSHDNRPIRKAQLLVHRQIGKIRSTEKKGHIKVSGLRLSRLSEMGFNLYFPLALHFFLFSLAGRDVASVEARPHLLHSA